MLWPDRPPDDSFPGSIRRQLTTEGRFEDGLLVFRAELHDVNDDEDGSPAQDVHHIRMRMDTAGPRLEINAIHVEHLVVPYGDCPNAAVSSQRLVGISLASGFMPRAKEILGAGDGCTHLLTMVNAIWSSQVVVHKLVTNLAEGDPAFMASVAGSIGACMGWVEGGQAATALAQGKVNTPSWRAGDPVAVSVRRAVDDGNRNEQERRGEQ